MKTHEIHFDSIGALVECASQGGGSSTDLGDKAWSGTDTFGEAVDLALNGWPQGAEKIRKATKLVKANIPRPEHQVFDATYFDVSGSYPDIARFCDGEPENMVEFTHGAKPLPIVTITYQGSAASRIHGSAMIASGAALGAMIDTLEADGMRCHLVVLNYVDLDSKRALTSVTVKRPEDPLDLDRLAFAVCHPAMLRRIVFGVKEAHPEIFGRFRYGTPMPVPAEYQGDIHVPGVINPRFTLAQAAQQVTSTVATFAKNHAQAVAAIASKYFGRK